MRYLAYKGECNILRTRVNGLVPRPQWAVPECGASAEVRRRGQNGSYNRLFYSQYIILRALYLWEIFYYYRLGYRAPLLLQQYKKLNTSHRVPSQRLVSSIIRFEKKNCIQEERTEHPHEVGLIFVWWCSAGVSKKLWGEANTLMSLCFSKKTLLFYLTCKHIKSVPTVFIRPSLDEDPRESRAATNTKNKLIYLLCCSFTHSSDTLPLQRPWGHRAQRDNLEVGLCYTPYIHVVRMCRVGIWVI